MSGALITDTALVFAAIVGLTAFGMFAEKKWRWASLLSGMGVSIFAALFLVTCKVLPTASDAYNIVYDYVMPLAIPMILVQANAKRIVKESGRSFILMNVACIGATIGGIVVGFVFKNNPFFGSDLAGYVAMEVGVCTGGAVNQAAMAKTFNVGPDIASAAAVGSNLVAVLFLVAIGMIPNMKLFQKHFKHPYMDELENSETALIEEAEQESASSSYTVFGFAKLFLFSFAMMGLANVFCSFMGSLGLPTVLHMLLSNSYLAISVFTLLAVTLFPKFTEDLKFGEEIGSFMLLMFMTVMGTGASIIEVIKVAPLIVVAEVIVTVIIMAITLGVTKIFKQNLEEALIAINASYGGPSTACAYVGCRKWKKLTVPAILIGVYGYIIGNVLGILAGNIFL